jgi:hypothetical protein
MAALPALGILCGCGRNHEVNPAVSTSPAQYEAAVASWIGRNETELFRAWGVPSRSQLLSEGGQALEYVQRQGDEVVCTTLFTSNLLGVIQTWTWRGRRCRVPQLED